MQGRHAPNRDLRAHGGLPHGGQWGYGFAFDAGVLKTSRDFSPCAER